MKYDRERDSEKRMNGVECLSDRALSAFIENGLTCDANKMTDYGDDAGARDKDVIFAFRASVGRHDTRSVDKCARLGAER